MTTGTSIEQAQADMRRGYYAGATGVAMSALAWLAAAAAAWFVPSIAIATLFVGGMLIHPAAVLLSRLLGRPGTHERGNPLARLAMESTVWLLLAIAVAVLAAQHRAEWFFVAMALTVAGRYFTFATIYGRNVYWACGATLAIGGFALAGLDATMFTIALTIGLLEAVFAAVIFARERK
jgi:hypothetical protein